MSAPCPPIEPYLDGRLSEPDAQRFEAHAAECPACEAALLADDLGLGADLALADLADVTCPPEVLAAARPAGRRAPDRSAVARGGAPAHRRRWLASGVVVAAALAVVALVLVPRDAAAPVATGPATVATAETPPDPSPLAEATEAAPDAVAVTAEPEPAAPTRPAGASAPVPERARPAPSAPAPVRVAEADAPADPDPTDQEIEAAARDLALAFALVDDAQSRARRTVRDEVGDLSSTLDHALPYSP